MTHAAALPTDHERKPLQTLADEISELSAHIAAATYRFLILIREFDEREGWEGPGLKSCAHWLNWKCGIGMGAAREKVRAAHALTDLPPISDAFRTGRISFSKVRAMTRVATPGNEEYLLMIAEHGTASHVERLVQGYRSVKRAEALEAENLRHDLRELNWFVDDDGSYVLKARLTPERGARVVQALSTAMDAAMDGPMDGESEEHKNVSAETSRHLACDSGVVQWLEAADGTTLDVGRRTRSIPPALRRALERRDQGCRFPAAPASALSTPTTSVIGPTAARPGSTTSCCYVATTTAWCTKAATRSGWTRTVNRSSRTRPATSSPQNPIRVSAETCLHSPREIVAPDCVSIREPPFPTGTASRWMIRWRWRDCCSGNRLKRLCGACPLHRLSRRPGKRFGILSPELATRRAVP